MQIIPNSCFELQAKKEIEIFKSLMSAMHDPEHGTIVNVDGKDLPLHLLSNAADPQADLEDPHTSSIFRISFEKFNELTKLEIQEIFKDRHILIYGIPSNPKWKWNLECLEELCPAGIYIEVQGKIFIFTMDRTPIHKIRYEKPRPTRWSDAT